jgi:hypothetical protein
MGAELGSVKTVKSNVPSCAGKKECLEKRVGEYLDTRHSIKCTKFGPLNALSIQTGSKIMEEKILGLAFPFFLRNAWS